MGNPASQATAPNSDSNSENRDECDSLSAEPEGSRTTWVRVDERVAQKSFADAVHDGLGKDPKTLPSQFFYDEVGSQLFEEICDLPEYYLTRAEAEILTVAAPKLAERLPEVQTVVELGSGSATKTEKLLEAFSADGRSLAYAPIDVSSSALEESVIRLEERHPELEIVAAVAEYEAGLAEISARDLGPSLTLWLGSSIGNLRRPAAGAFLRQVRTTMQDEDSLLVGIDLRKDRETLESAYDDAQGVTGRFNLNLLTRINRELGGDFDLDTFEHCVHYDEPSGSVQSFLESQTAQSVHIDQIGLDIQFDRSERIHTEDSHKYSLEEIDSLAANAGLALDTRYQDSADQFSLNLFRPAP